MKKNILLLTAALLFVGASIQAKKQESTQKKQGTVCDSPRYDRPRYKKPLKERRPYGDWFSFYDQYDQRNDWGAPFPDWYPSAWIKRPLPTEDRNIIDGAIEMRRGHDRERHAVERKLEKMRDKLKKK